jgi:hypothetical protein
MEGRGHSPGDWSLACQSTWVHVYSRIRQAIGETYFDIFYDYDRRRNRNDIDRMGLREGGLVRLRTSSKDNVERTMSGFRVTPYDWLRRHLLPRGERPAAGLALRRGPQDAGGEIG